MTATYGQRTVKTWGSTKANEARKVRNKPHVLHRNPDDSRVKLNQTLIISRSHERDSHFRTENGVDKDRLTSKKPEK